MTLNKTLSTNSVTYKFDTELTAELAEVLVNELKTVLEGNAKIEIIIFDLGENGINHKAFKILTPLGLGLRKTSKKIYVVSEKRSVHSSIRQEGMDLILNPVESLGQIKGAMAAPTAALSVDVSFVNPFIEGTIHVLNVQCQTQIIPLKPFLKSKGQLDIRVDIAGIIGLTSKSFKGSIAVCFPEKVYLHLMSQMLGETYTQLNEELVDGAGELMNMIFGYAKKILNENGHTIEKALPSVVTAPNLKIEHSGQDSIILPFTMGDQTFYMAIGIETN